MKKFTGFVFCAAFLLTSIYDSLLKADEGFSDEIAELVMPADPAPQEPQPEDAQSAEKIEEEEAGLPSSLSSESKYVKKASENQGGNKERVWVKYVTAAAAITVAIVALLLVKKDPGKRPNH